MISFRYHIVSLVAVFFAMAIGVLIGTNVISDQLVERLEDQRRHNREELAAERQRTAALEAELGIWDGVAKRTLDPAMDGKLDGRLVIVISAVGVGQSPAGGVVDALEAAGATIAGRIAFTSRWKLDEQEDRATLATAIGSKDADPQRLLETAARLLGARLRQPASGDTDVLETLSDTGFIKITDRKDEAFPPRAAALVFVQPGGSDVVPSAASFSNPLLSHLAGSVVLAATEALGTDESFTERITAQAETRDRIVTVDHVDTEPGIYSLVIGLADVFAGRPAGHFGTGARTSGVLPG